MPAPDDTAGGWGNDRTAGQPCCSWALMHSYVRFILILTQQGLLSQSKVVRYRVQDETAEMRRISQGHPLHESFSFSYTSSSVNTPPPGLPQKRTSDLPLTASLTSSTIWPAFS